MTELGNQLMKLTYEIISINQEIKFMKDVNSISVTPDNRAIHKLEDLIKEKSKEIDKVIQEMNK